MNRDYEPMRGLLGAYLLDDLDEEERRAFGEHLRTCPACRTEAKELEPVVAALAEAAPDGVDEKREPPRGLEEKTFARIEQARARDEVRHRRRRFARRAALTAVALLLVAVAGLALYPRLFAPSVAVEPVSFTERAPGIEADAGLVAHAWGTETRLAASGLEDGQTYTVTLLGEDGERVPSGTFVGTEDAPVECVLNAAVLREDVAGLEVRGAGDELMLYADLPEEAPNAPAGGVFSWLSPGGGSSATGGPETFEVPDVEGLEAEDAEGALEEAGFRPQTTYDEESRPQDEGKVLDQSPPAGEKLIRGAPITLTVGGAPPEAREGPEAPPDAGEPAPEPPAEPPAPKAPPVAPPPGVAPVDEAAPSPVSPPAEPSPPVGEQAPAPYGEPPESYERYDEPSNDEPPASYEQYPEPSNGGERPEQPYPEGGGGQYPKKPGYADEGDGNEDGYQEAPGSNSEAPDAGGGPEPDGTYYDGSGSREPEEVEGGGGSGYEGSQY